MIPMFQSDHEAKSRAKATSNDIRLRDPMTREYLHRSGFAKTMDVNHSWMGKPHQAEILQGHWLLNGNDWPFEAVDRNAHQVTL